MSQEDRNEPRKSREQIEAEIAQTRSALSNDLAALGEKLSPEHLKESARGVIQEVKHAASDTIREAREATVGTLRHATDAAVGSLREAKDHAFEAVSETAHDITQRAQRVGYATSGFVSTHAIPLSILAVGIGWLALSVNHQKRRDEQGYLYDPSRRDRDFAYPRGGYRTSRELDYGHDYRAGISDAARDYADSARDMAETTRYRLNDMADRAAQRLDETRSHLRDNVDIARERVGETVQAARSRVNDGIESARSRVGETVDAARARVDGLRSQAAELGHDVSVRASDLSHQAYDQLQRAGTRTREFTDENPLAVGALAVVAGVSVGLLLPSTRRENALLGETRDRLVHDAQRAASRLNEGVQRTANELKGALTENSPRS